MQQLHLNLPSLVAARESLFLSTDGQPCTTSRAIAERFGKKHKHVLRKIRELIRDCSDPRLSQSNSLGPTSGSMTESNHANSLGPTSGPVTEFSRLNFEPSKYLDPIGRELPEYRVTHDGFAILVMGFTGPEALAWKVAFLQAFKDMEAEIAALAAEKTALVTRFADVLDKIRPALRPVVEATEAGMSRTEIAEPLGKSVTSITYHRGVARKYGLLPTTH